MGKINVRKKGHDFERHVATLFRTFFAKARRGLQYQDGEFCPDVEGTPFHIECKRGRAGKVSIRKAVEQAETDSSGRPIIVITREDRDEMLVTMRGNLFFEMLNCWVWKNGERERVKGK